VAGMVKISGKYFDTSEKYSQMLEVTTDRQSESLHIASGLNITLYPTSRGLMLNVDLAMRVARKQSCLETINKCKAFATARNHDWREVVRNELIGSIAATTYSLNSRKQTLSIVEIKFDSTPATPIPGDPKQTTFAQYMKEHHNLTVTDMTQPMLLFRSQREVDRNGQPLERWFIPEFVQLVGQSDRMRGDSDLQQLLKRGCLLSANQRFVYISTFMQKIAANAAFQQLLGQWKMNLRATMTTVPSKVLPCPQLSLRTDQERRAWNVTRSVKAATQPVAKWCVVYPDRVDPGSLNGFLGSLNTGLQQMGLSLPGPQFATYRSDRDPGRWGRNLSESLGTLEADVAFVLIVLNDNNDGNYFMVKEVSLKDWNIPSQCVLLRNVQQNDPRKLQNITGRIAGQIIVKLGGALWATQGPVQGSEGVLLIGMSLENGKGCTALSLVAAAAEDNLPFASFASSFVGDATGTIQTGLNQILAVYASKRNNQKPSAIFVYRPGMNEGDVPLIISNEVIPLQRICDAAQIALVFINALKRCSIRFFPSPAGALVDNYLTPPTGFTFLVVPQVVTQGCATAMKFSVLSNSSPAITGDLIERVTFNQCHMFYGWWGATREPAVVMYSDRMAEMHAKTDAKNKPMPFNNAGVRVL
jgi:aubergine-like protein